MPMKLDPLVRLLILFLTLTLLMNGTPMLWGQTSQPVSSSGTKFMVAKEGRVRGQAHNTKANSLRIKTFFSGWHGMSLDR